MTTTQRYVLSVSGPTLPALVAASRHGCEILSARESGAGLGLQLVTVRAPHELVQRWYEEINPSWPRAEPGSLLHYREV
jgi:mevalonate kinase